jgi:hypothetical protein
MSKPKPIIFDGAFDLPKPPALCSQRLAEVEKEFATAFPEDRRAAVLAACFQYEKSEAAFQASTSAVQYAADLKKLCNHFVELLADERDGSSHSRAARVMRRAFAWAPENNPRCVADVAFESDAIAIFDFICSDSWIRPRAEVTFDPLRRFFGEIRAFRQCLAVEYDLLQNSQNPIAGRKRELIDALAATRCKLAEAKKPTLNKDGTVKFDPAAEHWVKLEQLAAEAKKYKIDVQVPEGPVAAVQPLQVPQMAIPNNPASMPENQHPLAELMVSGLAWNQWIQSMIEAMENTEFSFLTAPSRFVALINALQKYFPNQLRRHVKNVQGLKALDAAIYRTEGAPKRRARIRKVPRKPLRRSRGPYRRPTD